MSYALAISKHMTMSLSKIKTIHFIGIGGIGMSALARMFRARGAKVTGSDAVVSPITRVLKKEGIVVRLGHDATHIPKNCDVVVYTLATLKDNPELAETRKRKIPLYSYPEMLGVVSKGYFTIAVSGTHGKTTTTAMLARILQVAGKSPTAIVGSVVSEWGSNFLAGTSKFFVVEACEYKRSFLNLMPDIAVITNIDNDHLDYYGTAENVQKAFTAFVKKVPRGGAVVFDTHDKRSKKVVSHVVAGVDTIDYGATTIQTELKVFGEHNIRNAQAAGSAARFLGISEKAITKGLAGFLGTWRRQEYKGKTKNGALVYDDYAHHPTEIAATLTAFRAEFSKRKITVVFQPHLYSRTKEHFKDFVTTLGIADSVVVVPIYAAREKSMKGVSGADLANAISKRHPDTVSVDSLSEAATALKIRAGKQDVIITMGAGDIYKAGENMLR